MIDKLIIIAGYLGRAMVILGMACGCFLLWLLIVKSIF